MFKLAGFLYLMTVLSGGFGKVDIKKHINICERNAIDVNDCLVTAVRNGLEKMADGIEDLGVPALDPYEQKDFRVEYKNNQIAAKMHLKNIQVEGLKEAKVHDARLRADDDKFHMEVDLTSPKIEVTGDYEGEGQFNSLKIAAYGKFNCSMRDLVYTWKLDGIPEKNGDDTYIRIKEFYMRPDVGTMFVGLTNDNVESKDLIQLGISFANENWRTLYKELLPYAQANWNKIGIKVANKIFLKVPYDQLFPSSA